MKIKHILISKEFDKYKCESHVKVYFTESYEVLEFNLYIDENKLDELFKEALKQAKKSMIEELADSDK